MSDKENGYGGSYGAQMTGGVNYDTPQRTEPEPAKPVDAVGMLDLGTGKAEPVLDISTAQFMSEVIEASRQKPVLVDFWAPWCGPCKQLAPALEKVVAGAGGRVKVVKMNIHEHPEVAGQMGIQSIPAVVAFVDGKPVDGFMGSKPEREISQFVEKLAGPSGPSGLELALTDADAALQSGNPEEAAGIYSAILGQIPDNPDALAGYGTALLKSGRLEEARQLVDTLGDIKGHQGIEALKAAMALEEQAALIGDYFELAQQVEADPSNKELRFDLAIAMAAAGKHEEAADHLLAIIAADRQWREDGARAQLLQFFEAWGPKDPATSLARRRLSSLLFA